MDLFKQKDDQTDRTQLKSLLGLCGASCDTGHFWSNQIYAASRISRYMLVDAFLEEAFKFDGSTVRTSDELIHHDEIQYQTVVKRHSGDGGGMVLVAILGPEYETARLALKTFLKQEECNPTGVAAIVVVGGEAHFHIYDPAADSLSMFGRRSDCQARQGMSVVRFLRVKVQITHDGALDNDVKKFASIIRKRLTADDSAGFAQRLKQLFIK